MKSLRILVAENTALFGTGTADAIDEVKTIKERSFLVLFRLIIVLRICLVKSTAPYVLHVTMLCTSSSEMSRKGPGVDIVALLCNTEMSKSAKC